MEAQESREVMERQIEKDTNIFIIFSSQLEIDNGIIVIICRHLSSIPCLYSVDYTYE